MRTEEWAARRYLAEIGRLNDPEAEEAIEFATQERSVWWLVWWTLQDPVGMLRAIWIGVRLGWRAAR